MAKDELKQLKIDYANLQKEKKKTDAENERLKNVDSELVKAKDTINAEQAKLVTAQKQYNELLTKTKGLEKAAENYEDPKALKDELAEKKGQISSLESKIQEVQKSLAQVTKEKQALISEDDRSSEAMKQVQEKEVEIKRLANELESAKKKMAKYEGDFRFPPGGTPLLSIPMGDGKVAEFMFYEMKNIPAANPVVVKAVTNNGKAESVVFEKA